MDTLKIASKNDILLNSLFLFYKEKKYMDTILPIINGQSTISLRVLDWFVTNFSKKYNIIYTIEREGKIPIIFNVFLDYRLQLKAYSKKYFDPFCRKNRIIFYYQDKIAIKTTVGQLNFFRWALEYDILDFIETNLDDIYKDMTENNSKAKKKTDNKRQELSECATKKLNQLNVKIKLTV